MTEKEKMLAGLLYLPFCDDDDTLSRERERCAKGYVAAITSCSIASPRKP